MGLAPYGGPGVDLGSFINVSDGEYSVNSRLLLQDAATSPVSRRPLAERESPMNLFRIGIAMLRGRCRMPVNGRNLR